MAESAIPNVSLLEIITRGGPLPTAPSPAAVSYFGQKIAAVKSNSRARSTFFENAFLPWLTAFENPREWASYSDKVATRHVEYGATQIMLDAHDVPGEIQNDPNSPQNELRLQRFKPNYRQYPVMENRDVFTPITVDTREILRLMVDGGPESTNASNFVSSQITMAVNKDRASEFHTVMMALAVAASKPNLYHQQVPDIAANGATEAQGRAFATSIRTLIKQLADFTGAYAPAGNTQTVPADQVRLIIRTSTMQTLGSIAYATSFNPEYVFALPESQVVEIPDHYFDRHPALRDKLALIVDSGNDSKYGTLVLVDTFHDWGTDAFNIKSSENRALHHSSIITTNDFKTLITVGVGAGTQVLYSPIVPTAITGSIFGPQGDVANGGDLIRGQVYSTRGAVTDASGYAAGGWLVEMTSTPASQTGSTYVGLNNELAVGVDDTATSVTIVFRSMINPAITASRTYNIATTPAAAAKDGSGKLMVSADPTFAGGSITYTKATNEIVEISADGGTTWTVAGASPITVASGQTRHLRKRTPVGSVYPDGKGVHQYGPYTTA